MENKGYKFHYGDPGMYLELYLPTKFEGLVCSALDRGFCLEHVQNYLGNPEHMPGIREMLQDHPLKDYGIGRVQKLTDVLKGYSIYRVAGAFWNEQSSNIDREEVSVVRIMFLAPLEDEEEERFAARRYLRFWTHRIEDYIDDRSNKSPIPPDELALLDRLQKWLDDIALFMNGYVLHQVTSDIHEWRRLGKIDKVEDEIWVASFRSLAVNKFIFTGEAGNISKEKPMRRRIECYPEKLVVKKNESGNGGASNDEKIAVVLDEKDENKRADKLIWALGYDTEVVKVENAKPDDQNPNANTAKTNEKGIVEFNITGLKSDKTSVRFTIADEEVYCTCKIVVTE